LGQPIIFSAPATDPLLFWTNGGPGSSSIAYGFWTEHGPFRLAQNGTVVEPYEYSWNRRASVLYVEQPSGVGLSWSADEAHYVTNDAQASMDNLLFLKSFFGVFPSFRTNDFFVTGESYGGHYVPQLSNRILDDPAFMGSINMQGFWIGNPGINSDWYYNINEYAFLTFMYTHALLPLAAYQPCVDACGWDGFITDCQKDFTHPNTACKNATSAAWKYLPHTWDPYNVLVGTCHENDTPAERGDAEADAFAVRNTPFLAEMRRRNGRDGSSAAAGGAEPMAYDPCISRQTPLYMRRPDVLKVGRTLAHF
jgi:serine carboxypeptidase-like clade 2